MSKIEATMGAINSAAGVVAASPAPVATVEGKDARTPSPFEQQTRAKTEEGLKQLIAKQANIKDASSLNLEFGIDKATERVYAQVLDKNSGEVVKQIPSREFLEMMARVRQAVDGFFIDTHG